MLRKYSSIPQYSEGRGATGKLLGKVGGGFGNKSDSDANADQFNVM